MYLDEAVVELEADEGGEDGAVGVGELPDGGGDGGFSCRTWLGVEPHLQLRIADGGAGDEHRRHQQDRRTTATTPTHLNPTKRDS